MNIIYEAPTTFANPKKPTAVIEIPKGCKGKYEIDTQTGMLRLDRVLHTSMTYPGNYGFIPGTCANDGDALDILVLSDESIYPMTLVECIPIGVIHLTDSGKVDDKIIAVCKNDPLWNTYTSINDLPEHLIIEIKHFFNTYKTLEPGKDTNITGIGDYWEAEELIRLCREWFDSYMAQRK